MEKYKVWLQKAADDLSWTQHNLDGKIWYGACFTAQQVVEKSLKAYLIAQGRPLRKIHDVMGLLEDCVGMNKQFEEIRESVKVVYPYYTETRYPAYEEMDRFTKEQAEEAYENAKQVFAFVKEKLPR